jgi:hypothetical protein
MSGYRNLGWSSLAKTLAVVTPTYHAASTFGTIGAGRKELTPHLVTDLAALLGIDVGDLAVMIGVVRRDPAVGNTPALRRPGMSRRRGGPHDAPDTGNERATELT